MDAEANDLRGEVDLVLDGRSFVLRPSYTAIVAAERKTKRPLAELVTLAEACALTQADQAIVTTELIRAWGREIEEDEYASEAQKRMVTAAKRADADAIGEMLYSAGVMAVQPRLHLVLGMALTGGCLPSGELKPTEKKTPEIPVGE